MPRKKKKELTFLGDFSEGIEDGEVAAENLDESTEEEKNEPIVALSVEQVDKLKKAVPAEEITETAIATESAVRFIGGWVSLEKDKPVTAKKVVISALRIQGLVK